GVQGAMRPVLIVVGLVLAPDSPQMVLIPDEGAIQELASAAPGPGFQDRGHAGVRTLQGTVSMPAPARTASKALVKFDPRSRIMNLIRCVCAPGSIIRLRACCTVRSPVGCSVTPRMRIRRVACSTTAGAWAGVPLRRSIVKKSQARIAPARERRNCGQAGPVRRGAGATPL